MGLLEVRGDLVDVVAATAALPCCCAPAVACLACRAATVLADVTARGLRVRRWRQPPGPVVRTVHRAGVVVDCREVRRGYPRGLILDRRQACADCGEQLVRGRWAAFWPPGLAVAVLPSRYGGAHVAAPAHGEPGEVPCTDLDPRAVHPDESAAGCLPEAGVSARMPGVSRAVAYLRVSTDTQADDGGGLDVQEAACRAWARQHRHRVVQVCVDAGRSGAADTPDRPGLALALQAIREDTADLIVVYRLDRLARDVILQEQLLATIATSGGALHSTSPTEDAHLRDDPDDPTRALVRRILGAIAQYERGMIRLRMRAGVLAKAAKGGYYGGRPPYGWRSEGRELVPDDHEQQVRRRIITRRRAGASFATIAKELNADGIPSKMGREWSRMGVRSVVLLTSLPPLRTDNPAKSSTRRKEAG